MNVPKIDLKSKCTCVCVCVSHQARIIQTEGTQVRRKYQKKYRTPYLGVHIHPYINTQFQD